MQLTRIFRLEDPNLSIVYLIPFPITVEIYDHYKEIMTISGIKDIDSRLFFVVPENYVKFKQHSCLSQQIIYSPFCTRQVKDLIKGKLAYIVPGIVGKYDYELSCMLSIPILCGEPTLIKKCQEKATVKEFL